MSIDSPNRKRKPWQPSGWGEWKDPFGTNSLPDIKEYLKHLTETCPSCGKRIRIQDYFRFCPYCGSLLRSGKDELEEIKSLMVIINAKLGAYLAEKRHRVTSDTI